MHYLHFPFEHLLSQVLKDFSVKNLETTLFTGNFLIRSIYLKLLIIGVVFLFYSEREKCSVWYVFYPYLFSFFLLFFSFCLYFPWQTLTIHRITGEGVEVIISLVFYFHPNEHFFSSSKFIPLLLLNLFVITRLIADVTLVFFRDLHFIRILLMQLSRSYWIWHFKVTLWGFELISYYHLSITKSTP